MKTRETREINDVSHLLGECEGALGLADEYADRLQRHLAQVGVDGWEGLHREELINFKGARALLLRLHDSTSDWRIGDGRYKMPQRTETEKNSLN